MTFSALYNHCQTLEPKISRNVVRDKVLELTGIEKIRTFKTSLDITKCRGFFVSPRNKDHPVVKVTGSHAIVLAREGLNYCWERFVYVKELMHAFDDPEHAADSGEDFERMLSDLTPGAGVPLSPQGASEINCFWMALAVLCPEKMRLHYKVEREAQRMDDYAIALQLRIPQGYVRRLFEEKYVGLITKFRNEKIA